MKKFVAQRKSTKYSLFWKEEWEILKISYYLVV